MERKLNLLCFRFTVSSKRASFHSSCFSSPLIMSWWLFTIQLSELQSTPSSTVYITLQSMLYWERNRQKMLPLSSLASCLSSDYIQTEHSSFGNDRLRLKVLRTKINTAGPKSAFLQCSTNWNTLLQRLRQKESLYTLNLPFKQFSFLDNHYEQHPILYSYRDNHTRTTSYTVFLPR